MTNYDGSRFHHSKRRAPTTTAQSTCIWACEMCGFKFNKDHAVKCKTCRHKAPVTQFGVKLTGNCYMTAVFSARPPQKVELMRAFNPISGATIEAVLDGTSDVPLQTRIIRTFIRELGTTQVRFSPREASSDENCLQNHEHNPLTYVTTTNATH